MVSDKHLVGQNIYSVAALTPLVVCNFSDVNKEYTRRIISHRARMPDGLRRRNNNNNNTTTVIIVIIIIAIITII